MNKLTETQGKKAFKTHKVLLAIKRTVGIAFVEMGKLLKVIRDESYFEVLGYDSFQSYVINSELGFKRRTAYYYIEIYEWFVERLGYKSEKLADIGYDKLVRALPIIKKQLNSGKMEKLITDVEVLRPVDFQKKYRDEEKQKEFEDYLAPPEYFRCDCHGRWVIVVPIEDCCPEWLKKLKLDNKRIKG